MPETFSIVIHLIEYSAFILLMIHLVKKSMILNEIKDDITKFKTDVETIEGRIVDLIVAINNKAMIEESKFRSATPNENKPII